MFNRLKNFIFHRIMWFSPPLWVLKIRADPRIATIPKGNAQFIMNGLAAKSALTAKFLVSKFVSLSFFFSQVLLKTASELLHISCLHSKTMCY